MAMSGQEGAQTCAHVKAERKLYVHISCTTTNIGIVLPGRRSQGHPYELKSGCSHRRQHCKYVCDVSRAGKRQGRADLANNYVGAVHEPPAHRQGLPMPRCARRGGRYSSSSPARGRNHRRCASSHPPYPPRRTPPGWNGARAPASAPSQACPPSRWLHAWSGGCHLTLDPRTAGGQGTIRRRGTTRRTPTRSAEEAWAFGAPARAGSAECRAPAPAVAAPCVAHDGTAQASFDESRRLAASPLEGDGQRRRCPSFSAPCRSYLLATASARSDLCDCVRFTETLTVDEQTRSTCTCGEFSFACETAGGVRVVALGGTEWLAKEPQERECNIPSSNKRREETNTATPLSKRFHRFHRNFNHTSVSSPAALLRPTGAELVRRPPTTIAAPPRARPPTPKMSRHPRPPHCRFAKVNSCRRWLSSLRPSSSCPCQTLHVCEDPEPGRHVEWE